MRRASKVVALLAAGSLGLAACGTSVQKTLKGAISSVGAQQYLQVRVNADVAGTGAQAASAAAVEKYAKLLSLTLSEQSTGGGAISTAGTALNQRLTLAVGSTPLLTLISIGSRLYVDLDFSTLASLPGVGVTTSELTGLQLLLGGRWFELPSTTLNRYVPKAEHSATNSSSQRQIEQRAMDALTKLIERTPSTSTGHGYSQRGTLQSVVTALEPVMAQVTHRAATTTHPVPGTYRLALSLSGGVATAAQVGVSVPGGHRGSMSVTLNATITHDATPVSAPSPVTVVTPSFLKGLSGLTGSVKL